MMSPFPLSLAFVLASATLAAHDFWLASAPWGAAPGATIGITANVGDRFPGANSFTQSARVESLTLVGPEGATPIVGPFRREKDSLAADAKLPARAATYMAVMIIKPQFIEIEAADFASYLTHEGLERVIEERERRGESAKAGRERYSRYAKVVIRAGDGPGDHVTRPVGLKAELVPASDPARLRVGDTLVVRLLAEGRPVGGALVGAIDAGSTGAPDDWPLKGRTDGRGEVSFKLDRPGPWLIRSVHMVRRGGETSPEVVDWESFWASLTFHID